MMHVWYSNRLSTLVDSFIRNAEAHAPPFPKSAFAKTLVVAPNRNIESYLKFEVARRAGIAANLEFCFLEDYLVHEVAQDSQSVRLATQDRFRTLLLDLFLHRPERIPKPAADYIGNHAEQIRDRRRYQLAGQIARLFENYSLFRSDMLRSWSEGRLTAKPGDEFYEQEAWQADLWREIATIAAPADEASPTCDRWYDFVELEDRLRDSEAIGTAAHLFGFSYLAPSYQQLLALLGRRVDVHLYSFLPLMEFREDYESAGVSPPESAQSLEDQTIRDFVVPPTQNLFCRAWGDAGRDNIRRLAALDNFRLHPLFHAPQSEGSTFLRRLQRRVLTQSPPADRSLEPDDALKVIACPGLEREVEIISSEIWSLIEADGARKADESNPRLRFNDIAVIVADRQRLDAYQTHFSAKFKELGELPFCLADVSLERESAAIQAANLLLDLPKSECFRPDVMSILGNPAVLANFPDIDPHVWRTWVAKLGIYFGIDRSSLAGSYVDSDAFHWDQGLKRLSLGSYLGAERSGLDDAFAAGGRSFAPLDFGKDQTGAAACFIAVVRSLLADARFAREAKLTLKQWSQFFYHYWSSYIGLSEESEERNRGLCLSEAYRLRDADISDQPVSYQIAWEHLSEALANLTGSQGHFLADGVVVSSFLPMRPIPFRVVFIAGLREGGFPAKDRSAALDLRSREKRPGDVSHRERDKYLFLETLMSTADRLILSYVSRDGQTGDELKPSSIVDELFFGLNRDARIEDPAAHLTDQRPLRRYDKTSGDVEKYSAAARNEIRAGKLRDSFLSAGGTLDMPIHQLRQAPTEVQRFLGLTPIPKDDRGRVPPIVSRQGERLHVALSINSLRDFLECPLQGWGRRVVGFRDEDWNDQMNVRDEPYVVDRRDEVVLLRNVFWKAARAGNHDTESVYDELMAPLRGSGGFPVGLFASAVKKRHMEVLELWNSAAATLGLPNLAEFVSIRFGSSDEFADCDELRPPVRVPICLESEPTPLTITVEFFGSAERVHKSFGTSVMLYDRDDVDEYASLRLFLSYVVLRAAGADSAGEHVAAVIPAREKVNPTKSRLLWNPMSQTEALSYLQELLTSLLCEQHEYLLPQDAVKSACGPKSARSFREIVESLRFGRNGYRSLYGPVPHPQRFTAPTEEDARKIIEKRWAPFLERIQNRKQDGDE